MSIRDELTALQQSAKGGILHAGAVVQWAHDHPGSALHGSIDWDDAHAAAEYRLWQVRRLIQVHIVDERGAPIMVSLSIDRGAGGGYRPIGEVVKVPDLRALMLADALAELERVRLKYERVVELASVWEEAERVRKRKAARKVAPKAKARAAPKKPAPGRRRSGDREHRPSA